MELNCAKDGGTFSLGAGLESEDGNLVLFFSFVSGRV